MLRVSVGDWLSNPPAALSGTLAPVPGQPSPRHTLRQLPYVSDESLAIYPSRIETNRGNGYLQPLAINSSDSASHGIPPSFDCDNSGEIPASAATPEMAPCWVAPNFSPTFGGGRAPQIFADP